MRFAAVKIHADKGNGARRSNLAFGTMPVAATVISDALMPGPGGTILRTFGAEDVGDLKGRAHGPSGTKRLLGLHQRHHLVEWTCHGPHRLCRHLNVERGVLELGTAK